MKANIPGALFLPRGFCFYLSITLIICGCFRPSFVYADSIILNIFNPARDVPSSTIEIFTGTITNNTGSSRNATDLFFDFSGFDPGPVSLTQLLGVPDFVLSNGATSGDVQLFSFALNGGILDHTYVADAFIQDIDGNVSNIATVSVRVVPEPDSFVIFGFGVVMLALYLSRSRRCWEIS